MSQFKLPELTEMYLNIIAIEDLFIESLLESLDDEDDEI